MVVFLFFLICLVLIFILYRFCDSCNSWFFMVVWIVVWLGGVLVIVGLVVGFDGVVEGVGVGEGRCWWFSDILNWKLKVECKWKVMVGLMYDLYLVECLVFICFLVEVDWYFVGCSFKCMYFFWYVLNF